jgi:hypothetical protein
MAKKPAKPRPEFTGLSLFIENEDWVAIEGTSSDFERLGQVFLAFARTSDQSCLLLDARTPSFRQGSLGIALYRRPN